MKTINTFRGLIAAIFLTVAALPVSAADLVEVLKGDGPFNVFAPTDQAFSQLPGGTIESILKPEKGR